MRVLAAGPGHAYPLYYFTPSITVPAEGLPPWLVFHRNTGRDTQLCAVDLSTGTERRLTQADARDSGWAIWCEPSLDGVFNHLSALNPSRREVFFFDGAGLAAVNVDSLQTRRVRDLSGRIPIGQSAFSPGGGLFAFIHADEERFRGSLAAREAAGWEGHEAWRRTIPCVVETLDAASGCTVGRFEVDFHVHHLIFVTEDLLLLNHQADGDGMWVAGIDGAGRRDLRPLDAHGRVCHQVVTAAGIWFETREQVSGATFVGLYNLESDRWEEFELPFRGYHHTGFDPLGERLIVEVSGEFHRLYEVRHPFDAARRDYVRLADLEPYPGFGQRFHAHPFLTPCRRHVVFTASEGGMARVCALDLPDVEGD